MTHSSSYQHTPLLSFTFPATFAGPFGVDQAVTLRGLRIDKFVSIEIPAVTAAAAVGTSAVALATAAIPAAYRPSSAIQTELSILNNSALLNQLGKCVLNTNGNIQMFFDLLETGVWTALGNNGWRRLSFCYLLD